MMLRNLQRHKGAFAINLMSLSTGITCVLLIYLWINDELHFDKFHANDATLYQVIEKSTENGQVRMHESTQGPLAAAMEKDLPEVTTAATVLPLANFNITATIKTAEKSIKNYGLFATSNFFHIFSFKLLAGQPQQVLANENGMVVSAEIARSLFGSVENAMGKSVQWEMFGQPNSAVITGVLDKLPANNSMPFDFVINYASLLKGVGQNFKEWYNEGPHTYVQLRPGTDLKKFNAKIKDYLKRYSRGTLFSLQVRPYSSAYLYGHYENGVQSGGRIEYVHLFSLVAIFILIIACINFMNLSTARASRRLKEVGIKKAVGATRTTLVAQFMGEALFLTVLSLLIAIGLAAIFLPIFNQITGKQITVQLTASLVAWILATTLFTSLLAGSYPAFYLSGFHAVEVLKGKLMHRSWGELLARKGLVVFQFIVSLVLIIAVMVIYRQLAFVQSKNLGYDKAHLIQFDREGALMQSTPAFLTALKKIPGVINASCIEESVVAGVGGGSSTYDVSWPGKPNQANIDFVTRSLDIGLLETMGVQMKEGRTFSDQFGSDSAKVIINETAIKIMGLRNPLGTPIRMWGKTSTIVGVVKDFHITSLHEAIQPMIFRYNPKTTAVVMVRLATGQESQALPAIAALYKQYNPGYVFSYHFLDENYQAQYISEQRISLLSRYFAGLAILISCLGLFGLATFNAEVRTKEIGVRKALGASVSNVILLLIKDFLKLALIAMLVAFPLAWWAMHSWLNKFVYHIAIGPNLFILAAFTIVVITLLTVSYQSAKAALINPSRSLNEQ
ncbi:duplicated orphan permease [Chitinophaga costaii]|uniref:Duplicated orphan permease n=2 Tax=Chitinophaga costaii TaxID=1335309 RepID=A0A1C4E2N7_9BACT|nr:duplicated orphan permease [Chitinophaga costaii]